MKRKKDNLKDKAVEPLKKYRVIRVYRSPALPVHVCLIEFKVKASKFTGGVYRYRVVVFDKKTHKDITPDTQQVTYRSVFKAKSAFFDMVNVYASQYMFELTRVIWENDYVKRLKEFQSTFKEKGITIPERATP